MFDRRIEKLKLLPLSDGCCICLADLLKSKKAEQKQKNVVISELCKHKADQVMLLTVIWLMV